MQLKDILSNRMDKTEEENKNKEEENRIAKEDAAKLSRELNQVQNIEIPKQKVREPIMSNMSFDKEQEILQDDFEELPVPEEPKMPEENMMKQNQASEQGRLVKLRIILKSAIALNVEFLAPVKDLQKIINNLGILLKSPDEIFEIGNYKIKVSEIAAIEY